MLISSRIHIFVYVYSGDLVSFLVGLRSLGAQLTV